jgi:hypothetical protein
MKHLLLSFVLTLFFLALGTSSKPPTFALVPSLVSSAVPIDCKDGCGAERWNIKTLTDDNADNVDFTPKEKSVQWLRTRTRPPHLPKCRRLPGVEFMTFKIKGVVRDYTVEDDHDFHVVIMNPLNHSQTIIVEIPDPTCEFVLQSSKLNDMKKARRDFLADFTEPTVVSKFLPGNNTKVEVTGVGFFDRMHDQIGRALPSGLELHPVLNFKVVH